MNNEINIALIVIYILILIIYIYHLYNKNAFHMDAAPLTSQEIFWAAIYIPISAFFVTGIICWSGHSLQIDEDGFNKFLSISKLPLGLLSLSIPFGVVINNIHRTIQTDKQIKEAEKKNKVDGFYAHRKNTIELFSLIKLPKVNYNDHNIHSFSFENNLSTYKQFYPNTSPENVLFTVDTSTFLIVKNLFEKIYKIIINDTKKDMREILTGINSVENTLDEISKAFKLAPYKVETTFIIAHQDRYNPNSVTNITTKFENEPALKKTIFSYIKTQNFIAEVLEVKIDDELMGKLDEIIEYINDDDNNKFNFDQARVTNYYTAPGIYISDKTSI